MNPFLTPPAFQAMWDGPALTPAQTNIANLLLQVASNWIYQRVPGISPTDPTAQMVVFEVVSTAIRYGKYQSLKSFHRGTGHRTDSGELNDPASMLDFTDRHKAWLGIPLESTPMGQFFGNDFDAPDDNAGWPNPWSRGQLSAGIGPLNFWQYDV